MALKKVKGNLERMFDKNLNDLVRGIRNNKDNEGKYIAHCIEEIKQELRQDNISVKANAVAKLLYLQMLGYDISWAGFNIIEVMSSNKLTYKRIGYLAASQSFHPDSELLMLTTNMIRKDLNSHSQYDAGLALSGLSCFVSTDLAKDLANDMMTLLSSTKPYIRKKAVLMMYKIFLRFPEALRPAFPRLKEKLEDPDSGVQSACVNVVCELARKNPRNYLSLAPVFFKLMTTSTNNWMLIKIIKLFGALTPLEPRLGKKLIEPLTNLIHSTSAMSLLYECINTVIAVLISISSGMPTHSSSIQLCVVKLRILIEDSDQNLKYLGLLAMSKILATHPKSVQAHKDLVLQCLDDKDESIRLRALDLLYGMVSKKNLMEIVKKLMVHMDRAEGTAYRDQLLSKIIQICSQNNYQHITNFEWYVSVLVEVTRMEGTQRGPLIADQMMDVTLRVKAIRSFSVQQMSLLLENAHLIAGSGVSSSNMSQVLYAAAWICGEFASELTKPQATLESMLRGKGVANLPGHIQAVYIHNILKLFAVIFTKAAEIDGDLVLVVQLTETMLENLPQFVSSGDLEVQERGSSALHLVKHVHKQLTKEPENREAHVQLAAELTAMFAGELNPVAPKAQKKVQIPEGLDLEAWINEPLSSDSSSSEEEEEEKVSQLFPKCGPFMDNSYSSKKKVPELTEEELAKRREARKLEQANNLYYLKSDSGKETTATSNDIPVQSISLNVPLKIPGLASSDKYWAGKQERSKTSSKKKTKKSKRGTKKQRGSSSEGEPEMGPVAIVNTQTEMPEGAVSSGDEGGNVNRVEGDPHMALDIDLDAPLRDEERLPIRTHRNLPDPVEKKKESKRKIDEKSKSKKKDRKKKKVKEETSKEKDLWWEEEPQNSSAVNQVEEVRGAEETDKAEEYEKMETTKSKDKKKKKKSKEKEKEKGGKSGKKSKRREGKESELLLKEVDVAKSASDVDLNKEERGGGLANGPSTVPATLNYLTLAEDKILKLVYDVRLQDELTSCVVVSIIASNQTAEAVVKDLSINISDSNQVELLRDNNNTDRLEDIRIDVILAAGQSQEMRFMFRVADCTSAHKLRGTLTYKTQSPDSSSTQDKLDLWLRFPLTRLLSGATTTPQDYASLLISQSLIAKTCLRLESVAFSNVLQGLCTLCRLQLVEQIQEAASLYARTLDGRHFCVLVKANDQGVSLEGKSDSSSLLTNLFHEIKAVLS